MIYQHNNELRTTLLHDETAVMLLKNILQQVSEMPDGFPFETTIKSETFGKGRTKYIFT